MLNKLAELSDVQFVLLVLAGLGLLLLIGTAEAEYKEWQTRKRR